MDDNYTSSSSDRESSDSSDSKSSDEKQEQLDEAQKKNLQQKIEGDWEVFQNGSLGFICII